MFIVLLGQRNRVHTRKGSSVELKNKSRGESRVNGSTIMENAEEGFRRGFRQRRGKHRFISDKIQSTFVPPRRLAAGARLKRHDKIVASRKNFSQTVNPLPLYFALFVCRLDAPVRFTSRRWIETSTEPTASFNGRHATDLYYLTSASSQFFQQHRVPFEIIGNCECLSRIWKIWIKKGKVWFVENLLSVINN